MPPQYIISRIKNRVKKRCMNCGREYKGPPPNIPEIDPDEIYSGLCPICDSNNKGNYGPDDWHQQEVGE